MKDFPKTFATSYVRWQVILNSPDHFRAEARPSLRRADADARALLGFGLLFVLGGTVLALGIGSMGLGSAAMLLRNGPHPIAVREMLTYLAFAVGWFGLLYALFPKTWELEARPGLLRFGRRRWAAHQVRALEIEHRRGVTSASLGSGVYASTQQHRWAMTTFYLRLANGRRVRVWQVGGRARHAAAAWGRRMAAIAGVAVRE